MKYLRRSFVLGLSLMLVSAEAGAKDKTPQFSPLQIQAMQTREFEATKEQAFGAVMAVLQDAGYRIQAGDVQTGLITGVGSTQSKMSYNLFWGFGKSKKTPMVTAFIEQLGKSTRIRLNFVMAKLKSNIYGTQPQDEEPVLEAEVYTDAFEKVGQNLFIRQSMDSPGPSPSSEAKPVPALPSPQVTPAKAANAEASPAAKCETCR